MVPNRATRHIFDSQVQKLSMATFFRNILLGPTMQAKKACSDLTIRCVNNMKIITIPEIDCAYENRRRT